MEKRVLLILEFNRIIERLCALTVSEAGLKKAQALSPQNDASIAAMLLAQTLEAERFFVENGQSPVDTFTDVRSALKHIHAALLLSIRDLIAISRCFRVSRLCREQLNQANSGELLKHMAGQLSSRRGLEEEIDRCLIDEDVVSDAASPQLFSIRKQIRKANERIREKLNAMVKSPAYVKYLQEPIITIRNGRYVVPVKQEFRLNVPGLIHDQSGSGATLFIEPMPVVELGNDLRRLNSLEEEEIERVLAALTALVEPYADELYESIGILAELDLIFAKAKLGRQMGAVCPKLEEEAETKIIAGRHPLIAAEAVVPVDVWLGGGFSTLIITGPNTGGKTVTLKTIGLFSLMAQAGLFVTAAEGTALRAVKHIFADIGDEQSIEQNLSTFSAHMHTLVNILEKADKNSLVLLDELGAGTDPAEGAALAMSILDTLHDRGCLTAATTHYSEIKAFALSHEGMENASMEFDVDRLCPTFRLFIGIPGKSNAFEIASRLGLSKEIIEKARSYLTKEEVQFEDVLGRAKAEQRLAEQEKLSAQALRKEHEQMTSYLEKEKNKFENEKASLRQKAREEARVIVREARDEMERAVSELRACKEISMREAERAIQKARDTVREEEAKLLDMPPKKAYAGGELLSVLPGERVHVLSLGQNATVLAEADSKGDVQVQTGIIKLTVKLKELRRASEEEGSAKKRASFKSSPRAAVGLSLDLRGRLLDEALLELDRYLDDAALVGLSQVQLIHGKGTGALRRGIHEHLRHDKRVKQFRLGNYGEGDAGVTVVTLRE